MTDWVTPAHGRQCRTRFAAAIAIGILVAACSGSGSSSTAVATDRTTREAAIADGPKAADYRPAGYAVNPVFSDEFNGSSLDRSKWCTRYVWGASKNDPQNGTTPALQVPDTQCTEFDQGVLDYVNDEYQRYRDFSRNGQTLHEVGNGKIRLLATANSSDPNDLTFEAAMLRSKQLFRPSSNSSYYITARVKLPGIRGTWPTIWFAPSLHPDGNPQWPPEIDILETPLTGEPTESRFTAWQKGIVGNPATGYGGLQTATRYREFNVADARYNLTWGYWTSPTDLHADWIHVGAQWTNEQVCYFIENTRTACENYRWVEDNEDVNVPANAANLLINLAIGGSWAGKNGVDKSAFPAAFELDYIRVYERKIAAEEEYGTAVSAIPDVNGQQPKPVSFANGRVYVSNHVKRAARGGLTPSANQWTEANIDAGNCTGSANEVTLRNLTNVKSAQVSFCGMNAQSTNSSGQAYALRMDRPSTSANWHVTLYRSNGTNRETVSLASRSNAMASATWETTVRVQVSGDVVSATVTPLGGTPVAYLARDTAYRGNWVGTTIDATNGARPVWTWRYGLGSPGDLATVPESGSGAGTTPPTTPPLTPPAGANRAVADINGTKPDPDTLNNGNLYVANSVQRLSSGAHSPSENKWAYAAIDAGNCTGKAQEVVVEQISQATSLQAAICGTSSDASTYKGFAYALRLDRSAPGMPWSATLYRNNGPNSPTTPLASQANALSGDANQVTLRLRADATTIFGTVQAPGQPTRNYRASDTTYRSNWVGMTVNATTGARPTWLWRYNIN